jgi:hypothetical protein
MNGFRGMIKKVVLDIPCDAIGDDGGRAAYATNLALRPVASVPGTGVSKASLPSSRATPPTTAGARLGVLV